MKATPTRAGVPRDEQSRGYARWLGPGARSVVLGRRGVVWIGVLSALALAALAGISAMRPGGTVTAVIALLAGLVLMVSYLLVWNSVVGFVHRRLLARDDLGDYTRLTLFFGVLVGFPMLTLVLPVMALALLWHP